MGPRNRTRVVVVGLLIAVHVLLAVTSMARKSPTSDEILFVTGGLSYWELNDYRLAPEAGSLSMRLAALPVWLDRKTSFPPLGASWDRANVWTVGHQLFYERGNDLVALLLRARAVIVVVSALLALLVYRLSRSLFGPSGGMISLAAYCFSPTMLAHARLATADLISAAAFLAAVAALGGLMHRITVGRLVTSSVAVPALLLAKGSGILILPIAALIAGIRLVDREPWPIRLPRMARDLTTTTSRIAVLVGAFLLHTLVAMTLIWAAFGLRYDMTHPRTDSRVYTEERWRALRHDGNRKVELVATLAGSKVLPEGYLYGLAYQLKTSERRRAFAAGRYSLTGWLWFFPYAAAIKTPLATIGLLVAALLAVLHRLRRLSSREQTAVLWNWVPRSAPLLALFVVYGAVILAGKLNIGHRHLLPLYPVLFVALGACAYWLRLNLRVARFGIWGLVAALGAGSLIVWPDYLSFFNRFAGGPAGGYRHLVDSSLDWGQDLPALARWIERDRSQGNAGPVYLAYFGNAVPEFYGIDATLLPGVPDRRPDGPVDDLRAGTYAISATLLQSVLQTPMGPWCEPYEEIYQTDLAALRRWRAAGDQGRIDLERQSSPEWWLRMRRFEEFRAARLYAALRQREPDADAGHSILIYRVDGPELLAALEGPPAELEPGIRVEAAR